jgi:maleylpyruvate isomerase
VVLADRIRGDRLRSPGMAGGTAGSASDRRELDRDVAGAADAHQRLLADLDAERELDPQAPSRLPGWTIGHVLTHLARNADSHLRMLDGLTQYEHGAEGRNADIEAGASRPLDELVADVRRSIWALETRWATHPDWSGTAQATRGDVRVVDLPFLRWRETEVHRADLGLVPGHGFDRMSPTYLRLELRRMEMLWRARQPMGATGLPGAALAVDEPTRLAWLMGRVAIDGLAPAAIF